ncbi:hypothetical protein [Thiothrix lacustris]|uniref:hypothetical protein n=1 Tax=Thiothrix lacustris TaxID=525917 RepID=UPI00048E289D|nr:hypothetical protein [Thiothrix lacustris]
MSSKIKDWILTKQFSADGYFSPRGFAREVTLYQTQLDHSFFLSMFNGIAKASSFADGTDRSQYRQLISAIQSVTNKQQAYWFYGIDPDNALSLLSWVRENNYDYNTEWLLNSFESSPAPQGGVSWLGLVATDKQWLLLFEHNPGNVFRITLHGSHDLCSAVMQILNIGE